MADTDLDPENFTAPAGPDTNFAASQGHEFLGEMLHPFSVRRQFAAQALGNKLLSGRAVLEDGGAYDGMFVDVAALIYLCRCLQSEVALAARRPEKVFASALDWAEQVGMSIGSECFDQACEIYADLMRGLQEAQFKITKTPPGSTGSKND